ncbi:hypothetical protein ACOSP7_028353 [Xanthoceras sorbifolium]
MFHPPVSFRTFQDGGKDTLEYKIIVDDKDLQQLFRMFISKNVGMIIIDVELLPLAWSPPEDYVNEASPPADLVKGHRTSNVSTSTEVDFEYMPHLESEISEIESDIGRPSYEFVVEKLLDAEDKGGADSINEEADDENEEGVEGSINEEAEDANNEDHEDANNEEADDTNTEEADQAKKSDEDVLFDAATFNFDQDLMLESSSDDKVEQVKVNNSATRTSRKRKNFEVSSSFNAAPKRRKVLTTMEGNEAANSTQNVNEDASQPITKNAPLHSSQLQTQQSQSKSNAGIVAGLNINWSHMF